MNQISNIFFYSENNNYDTRQNKTRRLIDAIYIFYIFFSSIFFGTFTIVNDHIYTEGSA